MKKVGPDAATGSLAKAVLGIWQLKSRTDTDAAGQRRIDPILGPDPLGVLCFAPGHFAAQFMKRDRTEMQQETPAAQSANNSNAMNGYDAYFGTYTLDESAGALAVHLEGAISPANIGKDFTRQVRMVRDELIIQLATSAPDGTLLTRTLVFSRLG